MIHKWPSGIVFVQYRSAKPETGKLTHAARALTRGAAYSDPNKILPDAANKFSSSNGICGYGSAIILMAVQR